MSIHSDVAALTAQLVDALRILYSTTGMAGLREEVARDLLRAYNEAVKAGPCDELLEAREQIKKMQNSWARDIRLLASIANLTDRAPDSTLRSEIQELFRTHDRKGIPTALRESMLRGL